MAYTYDQLVKAWTDVHDGLTPNAAALSNIQFVANANANGAWTDAQTLSAIVNSADDTTAVAVLSYQFFTGKSPSKAGLDYLVNSATNNNDLNDAYYSKFSLENRYINFAANLGLQGEGAAAFATNYGAMSYSAFVASIYETIVGSSYATAAGIDPTAAIASIVARQSAILASANISTANMTAAQIDLVTKAATVGYLLGEAIKADVGLYAAATDNFMLALMTGTAVYNTNIAVAYAPSYTGTDAHGTGHAVDRGTTLPTVTTTTPPQPVHTFALGAGVDRITGTAQADTFNATDSTLTYGDTLDGGGGNDVLNVTSTGALTVPSMTVSNIETVNLTSAGSLTWNSNNTAWTGVQTVNTTSAGALDLELTGASIRNADVNATINAQGANNSLVYGGHDVTETINGGGAGYSEIRNFTGNINVTRTNVGAGAQGYVYAQAAGSGDGTTVVITQISDLTGVANGSTQTNGNVDVAAGLHTTSVQIVNPTAVAAVGGIGGNAGIANSNVSATDWNTHNGGTLGTLTTVSVNGFSNYAGFESNVLSNLTLTHGSGALAIYTNVPTVGQAATTLNLTINDLNINGNMREINGNSTGNIYKTLNITNGPMDSHFSDIQMQGLTTLTVGGTGNLFLDSVSTSGSAPLLHTITVNGTAALHAIFGNGNETITLGAGASVIDVGSGFDQVIVTAANTASNTVFSTLTINAGDTLKINAQGGAAAYSGGMGAMATGATFQQLLDSAASGDGHTTSHWSWFQYNNDTYIVLDSSAANTFQAGTDIVVKLVGAFNEGAATITNGVLTIG